MCHVLMIVSRLQPFNHVIKIIVSLPQFTCNILVLCFVTCEDSRCLSIVDWSDGDWSLLLVSQRTEVGTLPDINEPVYVITRIVLLPLNQTSARDLDITVCRVTRVIFTLAFLFQYCKIVYMVE